MRRRDLLALLGGTAFWPAIAQAQPAAVAGGQEIRIGNIMPYSGPASAFSAIGTAIDAYFRKVNDEGGVNGRKIKFISYDDGYVPSKTVEQARRLVEGDEVLLLFATLGTASNAAIQKYMNSKKTPQLFVLTGLTRFSDPENYPWTMGFQPSSRDEARGYAKFLLQNHPGGRIAILSENDDFGRDYVAGMKEGLDGKIPVVAEAVYDATSPTVDSQIVTLKSSGADIFFNVGTPKFTAQAIRRTAEIGWKPVQIIIRPSSSIGAVIAPAGLENAVGIISSEFVKDPTDPAWAGDPKVREWSEYMAKYNPAGDLNSNLNVAAHCMAQALVQVLKQCGDDLTRENVMRQAANLRHVELDMVLPGITANTTSADYFPIKQFLLKRFDGKRWETFGHLVGDIVRKG